MPIVTVLLPAYNAGKYIVDSIRSIVAQTLEDFELVVVLDPSTDDTEARVRSIADNRVRIVANSTRRGLSGSLNDGIRLATGRYVARMDADDIADPRRLAVQARFLDRHSDFIACGTWMRFLGERRLLRHEHEPERLRARLLFNTQLAHPTVMIRSGSLKGSGLQYDEAAKYGEDYDLWLRLTNLGRLTNIRRPLVQYRRHPQTLSAMNAALEESTLTALRRKALRLVGLEATDREIAVHRFLADGALTDPEISRHELLAWCKKLQVANTAAGYTRAGAMRSVLRERLWKIDRCRGAIPFLKHQALRFGQVYLTPR